MALQKTEAFVLKTQPFRSSSLIGTFFSRTFGKMRAVVKGVRREREMRGALFELFTRLEIVFYERSRSDLHLISEASILHTHDNLRTKLETITYASYFAELVDTVCELYDPHEKIFELLDFCYRLLPSIPQERLSRIFEIALLREIGWIPFLDACLNCQGPLEKGLFSIREGALFCGRCSGSIPDARPMSSEALQALRYYSLHSAEMSVKFRVLHSTEIELKKLMDHFLMYRLGGLSLKSRGFMEKIR